MERLRFAIFGTGFWSRFQLAGWNQLGGVECVAVCDRARSRAEALADEFRVPAVYDDPEELLRRESLNFLDIITDVQSHVRFVRMAADHRLAVICQKPMAPTYAEAEGLVAACRDAGVPLLVHENWRWQPPIRQLKRVLDGDSIGKPFRARIDFNSAFPVFNNQPFLRDLDQFILTDIGTHILDVARFLFGEAESLSCLTHRVHRDIKGEDVATVLLGMAGGVAVVCNMAYAGNALEHDRFPETYIFVEGESGSAELGPDYWVRVTTGDGTHSRRYPPPRYPWADPAYDVIHASIVPCHADLLAALRGEGRAETTGEDNLRTLKLVFAAYESAAVRQSILWTATNPRSG
ncbi:MAG: Gfo/Idh/MocA family oxidoreductase [Planctomycetia bacterium]|nr:Gfo/Idh/MocA family oxidoreductase [Planctomycetia bacterium]